MKTSTKIALAASLMVVLELVGIAKNVSAHPSEIETAIMPQQLNNIQIAEAAGGDGDGETKDDLIDNQEAIRLQSLAKITPQQAQKAAEVNRGGKASSVKLENEDGNLVYSVAMGKDEVKVDAGNGKVLYTESPKTNEKNRPHSSIRLSEGSNGDGDGETNDDG